MEKLIEKFKLEVIEASKNPDFIHHEWFFDYHLKIVEDIAMELCELYPKADRNVVKILVWLHDYGKMLDFENQYEKTLSAGRAKLEEIGFPKEIIDKAIKNAEILDKKIEIDLKKASLEAKIIASADGASHLIGPFYQIWFYEKHEKSIRELMEGNIKKAMKDWERKIVLPEVKLSFRARHKFLLEQNGQFPTKYLKN